MISRAVLVVRVDWVIEEKKKKTPQKTKTEALLSVLRTEFLFNNNDSATE